jgi:DNA polymerase-4
MNASNFVTKANLKTFSLIEYSKDAKMASLTTQMAKIRDKYGVDMVRYGVEQGELFNLKNG